MSGVAAAGYEMLRVLAHAARIGRSERLLWTKLRGEFDRPFLAARISLYYRSLPEEAGRRPRKRACRYTKAYARVRTTAASQLASGRLGLLRKNP